MLHSYVRIILRIVWATKNRERVLTKEVRGELKNHIVNYAKENGVFLEELNIQMEHIHAMIFLQSNQQADYIVKLIKGESSHWINEQNLLPHKFAWQRAYGAFSVSRSHEERVRVYIRNQDEHHRRKVFGEEFQALVEKYGLHYAETDESVS
jgi:REP element-mobilizing transposase RayT